VAKHKEKPAESCRHVCSQSTAVHRPVSADDVVTARMPSVGMMCQCDWLTDWPVVVLWLDAAVRPRPRPPLHYTWSPWSTWPVSLTPGGAVDMETRRWSRVWSVRVSDSARPRTHRYTPRCGQTTTHAHTHTHTHTLRLHRQDQGRLTPSTMGGRSTHHIRQSKAHFPFQDYLTIPVQKIVKMTNLLTHHF